MIYFLFRTRLPQRIAHFFEGFWAMIFLKDDAFRGLQVFPGLVEVVPLEVDDG